MNNYGNCRGCGKAIAYDKICMCSDCNKKYYDPIRNYLFKNKYASSSDISDALNIPVPIVEYYIKKDVIQLASDEMIDRRKKLLLMSLKESVSSGLVNNNNNQAYKITGQYHFMTPEKMAKYR